MIEDARNFQKFSIRNIGNEQAESLVKTLEIRLGMLIPSDQRAGLITNLGITPSPKGESFSKSFNYDNIIIPGSKDGEAESYGLISFGRILNNDPQAHKRPEEIEAEYLDIIARFVKSLKTRTEVEKFEDLIRYDRKMLETMSSAQSAYSLLAVLELKRISKGEKTFVATRPILITPWSDESTINDWERRKTVYQVEEEGLFGHKKISEEDYKKAA